MPNTPRSESELFDLFANNKKGNISAQNMRDFVKSVRVDELNELLDQGVQGAQGAQGSIGIGAQGASGNNGAQGDTGGAQGAQGASGVGSQGFQGIKGAQGDTGAQGIQGATGSGAQGNKGAQGAQGVQGTTGNGAQGAAGAQGNTGGAQGAQGVQGTTGSGAQGAQGVQGTTGSGAQGDAGAQGVQGIQGAQGDAGSQGVQGSTGLWGNKFIAEYTWLTAFAGATGNNGRVGSSGSSPTRAIVVSGIDANSTDWSVELGNITSGSVPLRVLVTKKDNPQVFFSIISNDYGTTYDDFFFYATNGIEGLDTDFATNNPVVVEIYRDVVTRPTFAWVDKVDAATITFDLAYSNKHRVTLEDDRILAVENSFPGQVFMIKITQDAVGSRLITSWFSTINWAGGSEPTLTTTPNKSDTFLFVQTDVNEYDGYVVGQNI